MTGGKCEITEDGFTGNSRIHVTYEELNESEKIKLLKELQQLENKWSSELLTHGGVHTGMTKIESDIKSVRNEIKYQDVQENLQASA